MHENHPVAYRSICFIHPVRTRSVAVVQSSEITLSLISFTLKNSKNSSPSTWMGMTSHTADFDPPRRTLDIPTLHRTSYTFSSISYRHFLSSQQLRFHSHMDYHHNQYFSENYCHFQDDVRIICFTANCNVLTRRTTPNAPQ